MTKTLTLILSATLAAACAGDEKQVEYAGSTNVSDPEMVAIGPDLDVVVGAREPVFRANNAFWLYRGDRWFRSEALRGNWVEIATPPPTLTAIADPTQYANYRADRTVYQRDLDMPRMQDEDSSMPLTEPQAPYPPPPRQTPPEMPGALGTPPDLVPDPTMPSQPEPL